MEKCNILSIVISFVRNISLLISLTYLRSVLLCSQMTEVRAENGNLAGVLNN